MVAVDPTVTVGKTPLTPDEAAAMFGRVCMATAPGFHDAAAAMAREGVTRLASTGTVFHPDLALSFKVRQNDHGLPVCSMAFGMDGSASDLDRAVAALRLPPGVSGQTIARKGNGGVYSIGLVIG